MENPEVDLEQRREEAAQTIDQYVRAALKTCTTEDQIQTVLLCCGMQMGLALKEIREDKERR